MGAGTESELGGRDGGRDMDAGAPAGTGELLGTEVRDDLASGVAAASACFARVFINLS